MSALTQPPPNGRRRLRVAFCLDSFAIGGTELNAVRTAEALDPTRVELFVTHIQNVGPLRERYERLGIPMRHLPIANLYSPRTALQGFRLASQLREWKVDIVHSHDIYCNIFAVPFARLAARKAVLASRRWFYDAPRPELLVANRWTCRLAQRVIANSRGVADLLIREEGLGAERIVEIPNFLNESAFESGGELASRDQRRAWGIPDGAFVVGIVARLSPVKNHGLLLRAMQLLDSRFHLVLIGDGPSRSALERMAQELEISGRVHFAGEMMSPRNLHEAFDASVLCSTSEGFPNSLIEGMAAAKPVVATPVGGVTDALEDGVCGILVSLDDPRGLADALLRLESDPQLRERLGNAGREVARRKYSQCAVMAQLMSLYDELCGRRSDAQPVCAP